MEKDQRRRKELGSREVEEGSTVQSKHSWNPLSTRSLMGPVGANGMQNGKDPRKRGAHTLQTTSLQQQSSPYPQSPVGFHG